MARVRSDTAASTAQPDEKSAPGLWLSSESGASEEEDGGDEEGSYASNLGLSWQLREVICQSGPSYVSCLVLAMLLGELEPGSAIVQP